MGSVAHATENSKKEKTRKAKGEKKLKIKGVRSIGKKQCLRFIYEGRHLVRKLWKLDKDMDFERRRRISAAADNELYEAQGAMGVPLGHPERMPLFTGRGGCETVFLDRSPGQAHTMFMRTEQKPNTPN